MPSQQNRRRLRRKRDEDGEDTESVAHRRDDSQSDNSLPSDDDGDADDSDLSDTERPDSLSPEDQTTKAANGAAKAQESQVDTVVVASPAVGGTDDSFARSQDTEAMMNGLRISDGGPQEEAVEFEAVTGPVVVTSDPPPAGAPGGLRRQDNFADRRRKEHEEYKKKRDADPAFIPTRGSFFMHDQRHGQDGARLLGRGRGRGSVVGGPFSPASLRPQPPDATRTAWTHDLHETLQEPNARSGGYQQHPLPTSMPGAHPPRPAVTAPASQAPVRNYSTTRELGHVQVRIQLPGMKEAVTYGNTLIRQYTKLPDHRPPLRRDKPVRISLPEKAPRYIFPAVDRSFIFIPRALRPNQQGFGRGRSKLGSMGGYSSRRTSVFGGSVYSPSVAMSRRSSFGRDFRDTMASPAGSVRPVVRLPHGSHHSTAVGTPHAMSGHGTPVMNGPPMYPQPPQKPTYRENWPANMPMHQPRPQKAVSVAGIESPASNFQPPPPHDQLPFSHQLPTGVSTHQQLPTQQPGFFPQQQPYPGVQSTGTPLSNIPERAIHAPAFQPYAQPGFQPAAGYYYPQPQMPFQPGPVIAPMVMQNGAQGSYLVPTIAPGPQGPPPAPGAPQHPQQGQPGVQQYEQNGMVYYYDPAQMYLQPADGGQQQYGGYAMQAAMPGMGGMMTPAPDGGYYYPGAVYYPQQ